MTDPGSGGRPNMTAVVKASAELIVTGESVDWSELAAVTVEYDGDLVGAIRSLRSAVRGYVLTHYTPSALNDFTERHTAMRELMCEASF